MSLPPATLIFDRDNPSQAYVRAGDRHLGTVILRGQKGWAWVTAEARSGNGHYYGTARLAAERVVKIWGTTLAPEPNDPGDLAEDKRETLCSKCRQHPPAPGQRYCLACHAAYQRAWRGRHPEGVGRRLLQLFEVADVLELRKLSGQYAHWSLLANAGGDSTHHAIGDDLIALIAEVSEALTSEQDEIEQHAIDTRDDKTKDGDK